MARPKIGDVLLELGFIDRDQLSSALAHHQQWGMPLAQAVIEKRFCSVEQVMQALSKQTGLTLIDLDAQNLIPDLTATIPVKVAERYRAVPLRLDGPKHDVLVVAIAAPASLEAIDAIQGVSRKSRVVPYLAADDAIARAIGRMYRGDSIAAPRRNTLEGAYAPNRELEFELIGTGPIEVEHGFAGLPVSADLVPVLKDAAQKRQLSEHAIAVAILEAWARRQKQGP